MRYAIVGASVEQIRNAGGIDIKETRAAGITFATLDEAGAARLKALGAQVTPVGEVRAAVIATGSALIAARAVIFGKLVRRAKG